MSSDIIDSRDSRWLRLVRFYTFNFPINKGKGRIFRLAKKLCRQLPKNVIVTARDGRRLQITLRDWADDFIYFLGLYELFSTSVISSYVKPGDVCLDVGANIGWYTTLFQSLCGPSGSVHAFEPAPRAFGQLRRNVDLNENNERVFLNNFGLGDDEGEVRLQLPAGLPDGHANMAPLRAENSVSHTVKIRTLDSYLKEHAIKQVDFVKADIEGAELMFLKGASRLFKQTRPPLILMEMSPETSAGFGHTTNDLIDLINQENQYEFFALNDISNKLIPVTQFGPDQYGSNVLCVPIGHEPKSDQNFFKQR